MERDLYALEGTDDLISPALIYYKDIILGNTKRIIEMAGGSGFLWPHVKSHKTVELIQMQISLGISRFKCATIAEAEMTAEAGAEEIILAYPLIGPNIARFLNLIKAFPKIIFYAIGDDLEQFKLLDKEANAAGMVLNVLLDVDIGMHRTGVPLERLEALWISTSELKGLNLKGLHCYDGHCKDSDINIRKVMVEESDRKVYEIVKSIESKGKNCEILVMGGSPNFPCRAGSSSISSLSGRDGFFLSPGTIFIGDWAYNSGQPDMAFTPGAAIFTRVVSHTSRGGTGNNFTLDLGFKGIATDPIGDNGIIAGLSEAKPLFQSEEHWVFTLPEGVKLPEIGSECYVIPTHICPTSALYPEIQVAKDGKIIEIWQVKARNRRLNY